MSALRALQLDATLGARSTRARLGVRPVLVVLFASLALAVVAGFLERRSAGSGAVDRSLAAVFNLVVPLSSFAVVALATGRRRLDQAVWPIARFGADRRGVALGTIASAAAVAAAVAALSAGAAVLSGHGASSTPLAFDALTSAWIGALTAAAYVGWFALGATFFRFGGGRVALLVVDFLLGDVGMFAHVMPRGLARNLLGLAAFELPQRGASAMLAVTAIALSCIAAARCGR